MSAKESAPVDLITQNFDRSAKSRLILLSRAQWWTMRASLAKRQIAAQHRYSGSAERFCQSNQQRRVAVGPRPMCEYQALGTLCFRPMQDTANTGFAGRFVEKRFNHSFRVVFRRLYLTDGNGRRATVLRNAKPGVTLIHLFPEELSRYSLADAAQYLVRNGFHDFGQVRCGELALSLLADQYCFVTDLRAGDAGDVNAGHIH